MARRRSILLRDDVAAPWARSDGGGDQPLEVLATAERPSGSPVACLCGRGGAWAVRAAHRRRIVDEGLSAAATTGGAANGTPRTLSTPYRLNSGVWKRAPQPVSGFAFL